MTSSATSGQTAAGTASAPIYHPGLDEIDGDVRQHSRLFTYHGEKGFVVGNRTSVSFSIDRPASEVWPYAKDWNTWQNQSSHYYSGVLGDLEGQTFSLSLEPNDTERPHFYEVLKVMPEHLIVILQPPNLGDGPEPTGLPGYAGVSPGFHVMMINEHGGKSEIHVVMEHSSVMARPSDPELSEEEGLDAWREFLPGWHRKWREEFIPNLKKLVLEGE
jgi:hypothetical protein